MAALYETIDYRKNDFGLEQFMAWTKDANRSLLIKNAFNPAKIDDDKVSPLKNKYINYTTKVIDFKSGSDSHKTTLPQYLSLIEEQKEFYSSWGISSMNDAPDIRHLFRLGAQIFVDECLSENWAEVLSLTPGEETSEIQGHFIAGNSERFEVKTRNHFVLTFNHVFQIKGEKTWYLCDPVKAMTSPEFTQYNPMEFRLSISHEEYIELPFVEEIVVQPGDYFYNAPLVGHAIAMGPGKNVMLSIRANPLDFPIRAELIPLFYRTAMVTRSIIHSDVKRFHRWTELMPKQDKKLYPQGSMVPTATTEVPVETPKERKD